MLAVVLDRHDVREFDQVVSLYTRNVGKIEVLAKGIKKITSKNSSNLEVFSVVDVEVAPGKEIDYLTKVQPFKIFPGIFADFDKIFLAGYAIKIAHENILVGEKDERVFDFLISFLEFLDSAITIHSLNLATGFIFKLWYYLGFSTEEEQYKQWLAGDWQQINSLSLAGAEQEKAHQFARSFVETHSGVRLAKFSEHW